MSDPRPDPPTAPPVLSPLEPCDSLCIGRCENCERVRAALAELDAQRATLAAHEQEMARLKRGDFTKEEIHEICHNLHGTVDAQGFADGCAAEQMKLYGRSPDRERADELLAALDAPAEPTQGQCEDGCNQFVSSCGARFCTVEEARSHNATCAAQPVSAPPPSVPIEDELRRYAAFMSGVMAATKYLRDKFDQPTMAAEIEARVRKYPKISDKKIGLSGSMIIHPEPATADAHVDATIAKMDDMRDMVLTCVRCREKQATRSFCEAAEPWLPYCDNCEPQYRWCGGPVPVDYALAWARKTRMRRPAPPSVEPKTEAWQPIETAPKDGVFLAATATWVGVCTGHFDGRWWTVFPCVVGYRPDIDGRCEDPTHWMPLPSPPVTVAIAQPPQDGKD